MRVLVVDVGGTHVKVLAIGQKAAREFSSGPTLTAEQMVAGVRKVAADWKYERVSVGYPGPVLHGRPVAEPRNLGPGWVGFDYQAAFGCPVKVVNDAAMQALGSYQGGKMLFLGLGTGLGSTLIVDGIVEPMELGHLPYRDGTFEEYVGLHGLHAHGLTQWRQDVEDVVRRLIAALEPEDVVLGGGNIHQLDALPAGCRAGDNANAFLGGVRLWQRAPVKRRAAQRSEASRGSKSMSDSTKREGTAMRHETADFKAQLETMRTHPGFIAALDQSGGSTPGALRAYGIKEDAWSSEGQMLDLVHQMRTRIMSSPVFAGARILGAILFENTIDRDIEGKPTADYLWNTKRVVPFLKVDKGLAAESHGVQLMKPMPELAALLDKANAKRIFGTKMRSFIKQADSTGIKDVVSQQFEVARQIIAAGLVPIIEPEVDIHCPDKAKAEDLLRTAIREQLHALPAGQLVMLKLTLPDQDNLYAEFVGHPKVVRVVALSGGYTRDEGNARLRRNHGVVASFSRALVEGLSAKQSDAEFNELLDRSIQSIFEASNT